MVINIQNKLFFVLKLSFSNCDEEIKNLQVIIMTKHIQIIT